jgi:predicted acetyltransferase
MPTEVRRLTDEEIELFAPIARAAYPGFVVANADLVERLRRTSGGEDPTLSLWGAFRDGALLGGMRYFDFRMSYHGVMLPVGGVGLVAVDLMHKKEHVARDMISAFLQHYRDSGALFASLYAFRPDFYRKMGFGYGSRLNAYNLLTSSFPAGTKTHLRHLTRADQASILACHNRYVECTHGLFARGEALMGRILDSTERRVVGYIHGDEVQGYLIYQFKRGGRSFIDNSLEIVELVAEHPAALRELLAFVNSQADQVQRVLWNTHDDQVHHLVFDPRNGTDNLLEPTTHETNAQGVGVFYRLLDTAGFFRAVVHHSFGGEDLTLAIDVRDSFLPANAGTVVVRFAEGRPVVDADAQPDVRIAMSVEHLSPLVMGSADFRSLLAYGLAEIDDPDYSGRVHRLFLSDLRPMCLTAF